MPSRERVVTTITTADDENGEGIVISKTVEIEPVPNKNKEPTIDTPSKKSDSNSAASAEDDRSSSSPASSPASSSSSPSPGMPSKSKPDKRKKKLSSNQRTLGSFFFKPQANTKKAINKANNRAKTNEVKVKAALKPSAINTGTPMKNARKVITPTPSKSRNANASIKIHASAAPKPVLPNANANAKGKKSKKVQVTQDTDPSPAPTMDTAMVTTCTIDSHAAMNTTPTNSNAPHEQHEPTTTTKSKSSNEPLPTTPIADIMAIVLGAHGDTPMAIAPPKLNMNMNVLHMNVDSALPIIMSHTKPVIKIRSKKKGLRIRSKSATVPVPAPVPAPVDTETTQGGKTSIASACKQTESHKEPRSSPNAEKEMNSSSSPSPSPPATMIMQDYTNTPTRTLPTPSEEREREPAVHVNVLSARKKSKKNESPPTSVNVNVDVDANVNPSNQPQPVVNELQPRKKVKLDELHASASKSTQSESDSQSQSQIHELQPRKKVKVNELQPRKKVKEGTHKEEEQEQVQVQEVVVNTLKPRKKKEVDVVIMATKECKVLEDEHEHEHATFADEHMEVDVIMDKADPDPVEDAQVAAQEGTKGEEVVVNTLQPRKKKELDVIMDNADPVEDAPVAAAPEEKRLEPELAIAIAAKNVETAEQEEEEVQVVAVVQAVNQLQPRKKQKPQKLESQTKNTGTSSGVGTTKQASGIKKANAKSASATKAVPVQKQSSNPMEHAPVPVLSVEDASLVSKYDAMRSKYVDRAKDLIDRALSNSLPEEDFQIDSFEELLNAPVIEAKEGIEIIDFQDEWVGEVAIIAQGSSLPVEELARVAHYKIMTSVLEGKSHVPVEVVASKIKLIAERTQYLFPIPDSGKKGEEAKVDIFSNTNSQFMWRWELISLDYLPNKSKATVKKARAARRKLKNHQKAVTKLVQAIIDAVASIESKSSDSKKQKLVAKVSDEEERVLKYEREEEKARLLNDAKKQKELAKKQKEAEIKRLEEERRKEKERLEESKRAEKAKMLEEKERKKKEALLEKANKELKRKSRMLSFFKAPPSSTPKRDAERAVCAPNTSNDKKASSFDSQNFWSSIGSGEANIPDRPFASALSSTAARSKRRKISTVNVRVFVPTVSDNPFKQDVYDEERMIPIRNRYTYLNFREDFRPPYHGTWSKPTSSIISGRNPFAKDTRFLDYDVDSEVEWEDGDDDQGEDCSENGNDEEEMIDDEEGDTTKYNYQDGWLAEDGDLVLEDDDEETQELRKKNVVHNVDESAYTDTKSKFTAACVIAPLKGGIPQAPLKNIHVITDFVEGMTTESAKNLVGLHKCKILAQLQICLDPFPPSSRATAKKSESANQKSSSQKMTRDHLITFAKFVHNSNLKSKDMVVEALRNEHKDITSSRAQAIRKLDYIATKRRLKNGGGVIWEVKNEILESLGLHDLVKEIEPEIGLNGNKDKPGLGKENKSKALKKKSKAPAKPAIGAKKSSSKTKDAAKKSAKSANSATPNKSDTPALVSPKAVSPSRKRKDAPVSKATVNLLTSFLKKKKTSI